MNSVRAVIQAVAKEVAQELDVVREGVKLFREQKKKDKK